MMSQLYYFYRRNNLAHPFNDTFVILPHTAKGIEEEGRCPHSNNGASAPSVLFTVVAECQGEDSSHRKVRHC